MPPTLPEFVKPMLARQGQPFDSDEHLFEIKWDGIRAQCRICDGNYSLINRRQRDMTERYPEFAFLAGLGSGTLLDGEVVVLRDGKPDFSLVMSREQARSAMKIQSMSQTLPAVFVVFDLLYRNGVSIMRAPLRERREQLRELLDPFDDPALLLSNGIVGQGRDYFAAATARELEGVMAKRLESRYEPGTRSDAWLKIKQTHRLQCAIVGFLMTGDDVRSLIIAAQMGGQLRCVGKVGSGLTAVMRKRLIGLLSARRRDTPWLDCEIDGLWVEPGLYCDVSYLEQTPAGHLRAPVFLDLVVEE